MPRILLACVMTAAWAAGAAAAFAQQQPARNTALAQTFYETAKSARKPEDALVAVRKALEYDPDHLGANLLLAEMLVNDRQVGPSIEQLEKVKAVIGRQLPKVPPPEVQQKLLELHRTLETFRWQLARWAAAKARTADQLAELADAKAERPMPSTVRALALASRLSPEDKGLAAQAAQAAKAAPQLPRPLAKPDPEGAKILYQQAQQQARAGNLDETAKLLGNILAMDPAPAQTWLDLALCSMRRKDPQLAVACFIEARNRIDAVKDSDDAARIEVTTRNFIDQQDPKLKQVEKAERDLAAEGRDLLAKAREAGDTAGAEAIEADLSALAAGRPASTAAPGSPGAPEPEGLAASSTSSPTPSRSRPTTAPSSPGPATT